MIPIIYSKRNSREVIPGVGSKQKDIVHVTGYVKTKQMIPVIGSKLTGGTTINVVGSKGKD